MVTVSYNHGCRLGNHLFQYAAARLLAERLGLAMKAAPLGGFPETCRAITGRIISGNPLVLEGADPIPAWPDINGLRNKALDVHMGFVNSKYFVNDRARIKEWLSPPQPIEVDPNDLLVSVRLGDFIKHGLVLDPSYYDFVLSRTTWRHLYLMTDDPGHEYLRVFDKYAPGVVSGHGAEHFLKALAFHRIVLSNSTFAWWFALMSSAFEICMPMPNGRRCGSWSIGQLSGGVDLRLDLPEVTIVYDVPLLGQACPRLTDDERVEALAFSKRSRVEFLA